MKKPVALHLVEKGAFPQNLRPVPNSPGEWFTGHWWVADSTAKGLVGRKLYLHSGQFEKSHLGGEIVSFEISKKDPKRKVFRFRELKVCTGVTTAKSGWTNEKKIVWTTVFNLASQRIADGVR